MIVIISCSVAVLGVRVGLHNSLYFHVRFPISYWMDGGLEKLYSAVFGQFRVHGHVTILGPFVDRLEWLKFSRHCAERSLLLKRNG